MSFFDTDYINRRTSLKEDTHRPAYHFLAPDDSLNDPNGTVYWKGKWHLFYQFRPQYSGPEPIYAHWGHAVSDDLLHWEDLPLAFAPGPDTYDAEGCWSGTSWVDDDKVIASYHGRMGGNCVATSSEDLLVNWEKHPANPVVPMDPARVYDPAIWKLGDYYYMISGRIIGAFYGDGRDAETGGKDTAYLWRSEDLEHWESMEHFYIGGVFTKPGEDCACPDFFPIGDRHMLLFLSHISGAHYYLGKYQDERFTPEAYARMNFTRPGCDMGVCGDVMAPISWRGPDGRRVMIAWMPEGKTNEAQENAGWAGIMTLPRELILAADGTLLIRPIPEMETLRMDRQAFADISALNGEVTLEGISGDCLEIDVEIDVGDAAELGIKVRCSPDGEEQTLIVYKPSEGTLTLDPSRASLDTDVTEAGKAPQVAPFLLEPGETLKLRVFVDRSVVEVFANDRQCIGKRIYPARPDSLGVRIFANSGSAVAKSIQAWRMQAVWLV